MKNILNIAEKPSIARQISKILGKPPRIIRTLSPFNPVYEFDLQSPHNTLMRFTSVRGHVMEMKFQKDMTNWSSYDPRILFKQKIKREVGFGNQKLVENIQHYLQDAEEIILWLDCDLEGEAIAGEVSDICLQYNPHITVRRARFSSLSSRQIWYAVSHLDELRNADIKAVKYRQELDFRIGCAMTNIQTILLKRQRSESGKPINFGTCLIPIINLIVQRYLSRRKFQPQKYWKINLQYGKHWFTWQGQENFTRRQNAYSEAQQIKYACITKIQKEIVTKKRPLPLDTSTLLKHCTRQFKIQSLKVMQIAQKLYQQGYISYPRTETNKYPKGLDLTQIAKRFENQQKYKQMVEYVLSNETIQGRFGKGSDGAHSPIYPLQLKKQFNGGLFEQSIYDYIVETFLATISKDAQIEQNRIFVKANNGYMFSMKGSKVIDKGFMNIIKPAYSKEDKEEVLPMFVEGQNIEIKRAKVVEFETQPPPALTEAGLIELMETNKIGTDATIPEHISNVQVKGFAEKVLHEFYPTTLGLALVQSYKYIQNPLANPKLRAQMEQNVKKITQNQGLYQEIYQQSLNQFMSAYDHLLKYQNQFLQMFGKFININLIKQQQKEIQDLCCHNCHTTLKLSKRTLTCPNCSLRYFLPKQGEIRLLKKQQCFKCKSKIMSVKKGEVSYKICPRCFNYPQPHMLGPTVFKQNPSDKQPEEVLRMPCFRCRLSDCIHSGSFKISDCPTCKQGYLKIIPGKFSKNFIGCSGFPKCKVLVGFTSYIQKVEVSDQECQSCSTETAKVKKCKVTTKNNKEAYVCVHPHCKVKRNYVKVESI